MAMGKLLMAMACAFLILGCERQATSNDDLRTIDYVYDQRTELCFAYLKSMGHNGPGISRVPCKALTKNGITIESMLKIKSVLPGELHNPPKTK